ncbi:hypothetical protein ADUPG1_013620, partial [Aduncisulcus paluster]
MSVPKNQEEQTYFFNDYVIKINQKQKEALRFVRITEGRILNFRLRLISKKPKSKPSSTRSVVEIEKFTFEEGILHIFYRSGEIQTHYKGEHAEELYKAISQAITHEKEKMEKAQLE